MVGSAAAPGGLAEHASPVAEVGVHARSVQLAHPMQGFVDFLHHPQGTSAKVGGHRESRRTLNPPLQGNTTLGRTAAVDRATTKAGPAAMSGGTRTSVRRHRPATSGSTACVLSGHSGVSLSTPSRMARPRWWWNIVAHVDTVDEPGEGGTGMALVIEALDRVPVAPPRPERLGTLDRPRPCDCSGRDSRPSRHARGGASRRWWVTVLAARAGLTGARARMARCSSTV